MVMKQNPKRIGRTDITDAERGRRIVKFQHRHLHSKIVAFMRAHLPHDGRWSRLG